MKVITWNCQMAFRKKFEQVVALKPDLRFIQEYEHPGKLATLFPTSLYQEIH